MKWFIGLLVLVAFPVRAGEVTLAWDPSPSAGVSGYKIYFGHASRTYHYPPVDVGNVLVAKLTGLEQGKTYYFACTAHDSAGNESGYSNEVFTTIEAEPASRCDLNGDGAVNSVDLQVLINRILAGATDSGDVNADGKTDVLDLQVLSNVILGRQLCPER